MLATLKDRLRAAQVRAVVAINRELVLLYGQLGREILDRQAALGWGAKVIARLSRDLRRAFPERSGLSSRNLEYMRAFAELGLERILPALGDARLVCVPRHVGPTERLEQMLRGLLGPHGLRRADQLRLDALRAQERARLTRAFHAHDVADERPKSRHMTDPLGDGMIVGPECTAAAVFPKTSPTRERTMNKHKLTLLGGSHGGELRVPADLLHEAVGALIEGARQATRFFVEGQSTRKGPRPAWLDAVCRIEITALSAGSAVVALEAPTLEEADVARFGDGGQGTLFEEPEHKVAKQTAVELFGSVLAAAIEGRIEEVLADRALLDTCARFARVGGGEFRGVRLDGLSGHSEPLIIGPDHVPQLELLRDETPEPQAVRMTGTLDTISASRADVLLELPNGTKIPARLEDHDAELLQRLFGRSVVVSGIARFRPSGQLLLIDVETLAEAREADELFTSAPVASSRQPVFRAAQQDETTGVSAFFGTWPGDESEEDLLAALRAIR